MLDDTNQPPDPAPGETFTPPDAQAQAQETAAEVGHTPAKLPSLSDYAQDLQGAARKMRSMVQGAHKAKEHHLLAAAVNHLHEAGQWLEKAAICLQKAGV